MTRLALKDDLLDAQLKRAAAYTACGGAQLGDCLAAAARIDEASLGSWHDAWLALAVSASELAEREESAGRLETARSAYFRAANYHRSAWVMLLGAPLDGRVAAANARETECFRRGAALLERPPEIIEVPYEATTLPGYFFKAAADMARRATVVLVGGYDGSAEELYFANGAAALARGYNVLAFDGPGQGAALIQRGMTLRPDWEHVIGPVLDHALTRPDVDPERVALIGWSLGAHLAPRAASAEHRVAACVADCGSFDLHASALARMPGPLAASVARGNRAARAAVREVMHRLERKPTAGWAIRRGLLVHGVADVLDWLDALTEFSLAGRAEQVRCPTWVCNAESDDISASAPELHAALTCPKELVTFTAAEGAGDHCEVAARELYHARSFGWLDGILSPRDTSTSPAQQA